MATRIASPTSLRRREKGLALVLLLILSGIAAVLLVYQILPDMPTDQDRERVTQEALAKARDALIAYVVSGIDRDTQNYPPGFLPCPAQSGVAGPDNEGYAMPGNCGALNESVIGRLPWKTLGLPPVRDGHGECLWYAVSGNFKEGGTTRAQLLNWDTPGQFEVLAADGVSKLAGATPETRAAAVIIAPGPVLRSQNRTAGANSNHCPGNDVASNYLEAVQLSETVSADNASPASTLSTPANIVGGGYSRLINGRVDPASGEIVVNDRMIVITPQEIFDAIERRESLLGTAAKPGRLRKLTKTLASCMAGFPKAARAGSATDRRLLHGANLMPANYSRNFDYAESWAEREGRITAFTTYTTTDPGTDPSPRNLPPPDLAAPNALLDAICPAAYWSRDRWWFQHWKDHLFYALAEEFTEDGGNPANTTCTGTCLTVNGAGTNPGIVVFAGRSLPAAYQTRLLTTDRGDPRNYLEGLNFLRYNPRKSGVGFQSGPPTPLFNDVVYCIRTVPAGTEGTSPLVEEC